MHLLGRAATLAYVAVSGTHVVALQLGRDDVARATKLLAMPALALTLVPPATPAGRAALAAVVASFAGDNVGRVFGDDTTPTLAAMLVGFGVAHAAYCVAFLPATRRRPRPVLALLYGATAAAVVAGSWRRAGSLRPGLIPYAALITGTAATASSTGPLGVAGGGAFLASDAAIALRLFRGVTSSDAAVMAAYLVAQGLLVAAARKAL